MLILVFKVEMPPCTCYRMGGPLQRGLHHRKWDECRPLTLHPSWDMEEDTFNDQIPLLKKGKIQWCHGDGGRKSRNFWNATFVLNVSATFAGLPFHTSCQEISLTGCKWICAEHNRRPEEEMLSERVSNLPVSRSLWCHVKLNRQHETICSRSLGPSGLQILIALNGYCRCDNYLSLFQSCTDICSLIKVQVALYYIATKHNL